MVLPAKRVAELRYEEMINRLPRGDGAHTEARYPRLSDLIEGVRGRVKCCEFK